MSLLAIDPGYTRSAWVAFTDNRPVSFGLEPNDVVLERIRECCCQTLAIESVASYGMAVGAEVFETCVWSGRFIQRWADGMRRVPDGYSVRGNDTVRRIYRRDVKLHLCGQARAKDANVRAALIDRYGPGKELAVGRKASPGPLYGVKADIWAALAVAVTAWETTEEVRA